MTDDLAYVRGMEQLVAIMQAMCAGRELATMAGTVVRAARALTGADGTSFAVREGEHCHHLEDDAIAPLWKGQRFSLARDPSGWAMRNAEAIVVEDVHADERVVAESYRPTFVRSLLVVPIRVSDPIGALGAYWATPRRASAGQVRLLQALADTAAIAISSLDRVAHLESRVAERNAHLEAADRELEAFSYAVSHDLRAPLRAITGFSRILIEDHAEALGGGKQHLDRICAATARMASQIEDLLQFSRMAGSELDRRAFDLAQRAREITDELRDSDPERVVEIVIPAALPAQGDPRLVRVVLENLLRNAWKFSSKRAAARIEVGAQNGAYFVRDNGTGFDPARADKLFTPFHRLHAASEFEGTGVGLASAQRIVHRHGGRIWAESAPDRGATFYFTLG